MYHPPRITDALPPIGGRIKDTTEDFRVEEIPLYGPSGEGQHVYVRLTRQSMTTRDVEERLASIFDLKHRAIGYAGKKDKRAVTTQTFSLDLPSIDLDEVRDRLQAEENFDIVWVERHRNKIKQGHLIGNKFTVVVSDLDVTTEEALDRASEISAQLKAHGLPNFYGEQRFGNEGDNAERGLDIIKGREREGRRWLRRLLTNAYQSELFNRWLARRIESDRFDTLLAGDVAKKTDTGGLFDVEDVEAERPRFRRRDITYTGPMYGSELWWASDEAGALERQVFEASDVTVDELDDAGLRGSRRRAAIFLDDIEIDEHPRGLEFVFSLPKGAYATVLIREFTGAESQSLRSSSG
jgi:tRNA pseudouridine13 synthase